MSIYFRNLFILTIKSSYYDFESNTGDWQEDNTHNNPSGSGSLFFHPAKHGQADCSAFSGRPIDSIFGPGILPA